jgi:hypothetical protein
VVRAAAAACGGEEAVEQDEVVRDVVVVGDVAVVVVAHRQRLGLALVSEGVDEPVHLTVAVLGVEHRRAVAEIDHRPRAEVDGLRTALRRIGEAVRHAHVRGPSVGARVRAEVVVERVVLLQQEHEVADRRGRRGFGGTGGGRCDQHQRGDERAQQTAAHARTA